MRYAINFNRTVNQLIPYYLGGRKLILFLQSCLKPLQKSNDQFVDWAKEVRIEASMTSQIFKFEWFLNRKFKKYFEDPLTKITIQNGGKLGKPIFYQSAEGIMDADQFIISGESEIDTETAILHKSNEQTDSSSFSFIVYCPKLWENEGKLRDNITKKEFVAMLTYYIDKYKISGKTYQIMFS